MESVQADPSSVAAVTSQGSLVSMSSNTTRINPTKLSAFAKNSKFNAHLSRRVNDSKIKLKGSRKIKAGSMLLLLEKGERLIAEAF